MPRLRLSRLGGPVQKPDRMRYSGTMKNGACPKCDERDVYAIDQVLVPNYEYVNTIEPFTLTAHYGESGKYGLFGAKKARLGVYAEARVCSACGYTELYAKDLQLLARFAAAGHGGVRRVRVG